MMVQRDRSRNANFEENTIINIEFEAYTNQYITSSCSEQT
jgi:hypothetical protein